MNEYIRDWLFLAVHLLMFMLGLKLVLWHLAFEPCLDRWQQIAILVAGGALCGIAAKRLKDRFEGRGW